jgi:hypothetical protein
LVERPHLGAVASIQGSAPGGLAKAPEPETEQLAARGVPRDRGAEGAALPNEDDTESATTPAPGA